MSKGEGGFTSRWGLVLTALGAAIGTGNIWRFPMKVATYGGGSFLIPYVLFLFLWSIPLLIGEFALGKATRMGTIGTFKKFVGKKYTWMGVWMTLVTAAINFYYAVVMGWVIRYFYIASIGDISGDTKELWNSFLTSPAQVIFFQFLAVIIGAAVVYKGIEKGIEKVNMILIPVLFIIMIITAIWAISLPGSMNGIIYFFTPQSDPTGTNYMFRADTWVNALAQSAWSASAGMGMAITYAVYMRKREDTNLNSIITGLGNSSISIIVGIAVFGTVFALSSNPTEVMASDATALTFIHLTALFNTMPYGSLIAAMFFLGMAFAALTSLISGYENAVRNFMDAGWSRSRSIKLVATVTLIMGLPSAAVIGYINGEPTAAFLENQDNVWGLALIVSGLFVSFAIWKFGVDKFRKKYINTPYADVRIGKWWTYIISYLFPVLIVVLLGWYTWGTYNSDPARWWVGGPIGLALMLGQWAAVLLVIFILNDRIADKIHVGSMGETIKHTWRRVKKNGEEIFILDEK